MGMRAKRPEVQDIAESVPRGVLEFSLACENNRIPVLPPLLQTAGKTCRRVVVSNTKPESPVGLSSGSEASLSHPSETRIRWGISLFGAVSVMGALLGGFFAGGSAKSPPLPPDHPRAIDGFTLTGRCGRTVTRKDLRGKFCVVSFVATTCGMGCLEISRQMAEVQKWVADQPDALLLTITLDPRGDTPEVLQRFATKLDADPVRWLFLTGDRNILFPFIETSFLPRLHEGEPEALPGGFSRADQLILVDPRGTIRAYFDSLNVATPRSVHEEIARLRRKDFSL